jgi:acyl-coenzyme A thioesterase PaaI-like protein
MTTKDSELKPLYHSAQNNCFGCGTANESGLQLTFSLAPDGTVVSLVELSARFSGPPGYIHGGILATLMDEGMSKALRVRGPVAMTRHMEVDYLRPAPVETLLRLEARHLREEGRKHWCEAVLLDATGMALTRGKGLFIALDPEKVASHLASGR